MGDSTGSGGERGVVPHKHSSSGFPTCPITLAISANGLRGGLKEGTQIANGQEVRKRGDVCDGEVDEGNVYKTHFRNQRN